MNTLAELVKEHNAMQPGLPTEVSGAMWVTITEKGDGLTFNRVNGATQKQAAGDHIPVQTGYGSTLVADGLAVPYRGQAAVAKPAPEKAPVVSLDDLGLPPKLVEMFKEVGYDTPARLAQATDDELLALPGVGGATVAKVREQLGG